MAKIRPILFKKNSLAREILFWMALAGLVPFVALAIPEYFFAEKALINAEKKSLQQALNSRSFLVNEWLHNVRKDLDFISHSNCIQGTCSHSCLTPGPGNSCPFQESVLKSHPAYRSIQAYDQDLSLISRTGDQQNCFKDISSEQLRKFFPEGQTFHLSKEHCFVDDRTILTAGMKVYLPKTQKHSYIIAHLDLTAALSSLDHEPFMDTGKFYILSRQGVYLYPPRNYPSLHRQKSNLNTTLLASGSEVFLEYEDFRQEPVFASYTAIPKTDWLLVKEVDKDIVIRWRFMFSKLTAIACFITLVIVFTISLITSRRLTKPLQTLVDAANSISLGEIDNWQRNPEFFHQEVDQVGRAFNDMQERLGASEKALVKAACLAAIGEFSTKIVHDIRSPLSSINIALAAMAKGDLNARDRERLDIAREQARRLMHMADGMLSYGKPLQLTLEKFTLGQLFDELIGFLGSVLVEKELNLRISRGENLEISLWGDRELLVQALTNLVNNAAQWSPRQGIIELEGKLAPESNQELWLRIADSGPGFNEKTISRLFEPFFTTRKKGTGLGLANTKKIIDYHNGTISASNRPGGGAEIIITLPTSERSGHA
jgi:signal transduction histidine kinase